MKYSERKLHQNQFIVFRLVLLDCAFQTWTLTSSWLFLYFLGDWVGVGRVMVENGMVLIINMFDLIILSIIIQSKLKSFDTQIKISRAVNPQELFFNLILNNQIMIFGI